MKKFSLSFVFFLLLARSVWASESAPTLIDRQSINQFAQGIGAAASPFHEYVFDWHESELEKTLPAEAIIDPDKIFVSIDRPLQETIDLEDQGEIEKGVTYGLEIYAKIPASIEQVMETILFRWGKPLGKFFGITYPIDSVFGFREESIEEKWGPYSYLNRSIKTNGGIAKDIRDDLYLLVRENAGGYDLAGGFVRAAGNTSTKTYFMLTQVRPLSDGTVSYKVSGRQMGQSYTQLGLEFGRKNFGFNRERIRGGQKDFQNMVDEYKRTGKIRERKPHVEGFEPLF